MVELVVGALRHWAARYRIDGFRLDLAVTTGRDRHGHFDTGAPLFAAIAADPLLAPVRGVFAAQLIKPQAKTLAGTRGIACVSVDYDLLRGLDNAEDRLF